MRVSFASAAVLLLLLLVPAHAAERQVYPELSRKELRSMLESGLTIGTPDVGGTYYDFQGKSDAGIRAPMQQKGDGSWKMDKDGRLSVHGTLTGGPCDTPEDCEDRNNPVAWDFELSDCWGSPGVIVCGSDD